MIQKLKKIVYGVTDKRGIRTTTVEQSDIEELCEKLNEVIEEINSHKECLHVNVVKS